MTLGLGDVPLADFKSQARVMNRADSVVTGDGLRIRSRYFQSLSQPQQKRKFYNNRKWIVDTLWTGKKETREELKQL
jgi:hypothetical protein